VENVHKAGQNFFCDSFLPFFVSGLEINLEVIPVIMTGGSLNLPVTAEFMTVIVTP
jgi:hypothetical protein